MSRINELLSRNNETMMFVTYFLGILDVRTGEVRYTNAGHNPPCIRRAGGALELLSTRHGPALGVVPGTVYGSGSVQLGDGDTFVLYTDGVTRRRIRGTTRSAPGRCCGYLRIARIRRRPDSGRRSCRRSTVSRERRSRRTTSPS